MKVLVLNGPNLGRLGRRQPEIYGATSHDQLAARLVDFGSRIGVDVEVRQSDHEGVFIEWLHEAADAGWPCVINAGAWTHYSHAIADAAALVTYVEVHISNVYAREGFRHVSVLSAKAVGVIVGCGLDGYEYAISHLARGVDSRA